MLVGNVTAESIQARRYDEQPITQLHDDTLTAAAWGHTRAERCLFEFCALNSVHNRRRLADFTSDIRGGGRSALGAK